LAQIGEVEVGAGMQGLARMSTRITRRRRVLLFGVSVLALTAMAACQRGVMWTPCSPAADGNPFGVDDTYVLHCKDGEWVPIMTVEEYLRLRRGERGFTIAPLPTRPTVPEDPGDPPGLPPELPPPPPPPPG
jgi:hypothetical protein